MTTIWGVDPASKSLALVGHNGLLTSVRKITVPRSERSTELRRMRDEFEQAMSLDSHNVIFVEEPVVGRTRNLRTTILIAETVGMVLSYSRFVYLAPVASWKVKTVGRGDANKEDVRFWLKTHHETYHRLCEDDGDLVDAAAICLYGQQVMDLSRSSVT